LRLRRGSGRLRREKKRGLEGFVVVADAGAGAGAGSSRTWSRDKEAGRVPEAEPTDEVDEVWAPELSGATTEALGVLGVLDTADEAAGSVEDEDETRVSGIPGLVAAAAGIGSWSMRARCCRRIGAEEGQGREDEVKKKAVVREEEEVGESEDEGGDVEAEEETQRRGRWCHRLVPLRLLLLVLLVRL
jgi:hypothetical protein